MLISDKKNISMNVYIYLAITYRLGTKIYKRLIKL